MLALSSTFRRSLAEVFTLCIRLWTSRSVHDSQDSFSKLTQIPNNANGALSPAEPFHDNLSPAYSAIATTIISKAPLLFETDAAVTQSCTGAPSISKQNVSRA